MAKKINKMDRHLVFDGCRCRCRIRREESNKSQNEKLVNFR